MRMAETRQGAPAQDHDLEPSQNTAIAARPGWASRVYLYVVSKDWAAARLSRLLLAGRFSVPRHADLLKEVEQEATKLPTRLLRVTLSLLEDRRAIARQDARGLINALRYEDYRRMQDTAVLS